MATSWAPAASSPSARRSRRDTGRSGRLLRDHARPRQGLRQLTETGRSHSAIASRVDDAFAPGTRTQCASWSACARTTITTSAWLAGSSRFRTPRPVGQCRWACSRAMQAAARMASVKAKGYYLGRASYVCRRTPRGRQRAYFLQATSISRSISTGQLALERLGQRVPLPGANAPRIEPDRRRPRRIQTAFRCVQAAKMLGAQGAWGDPGKFVRAIAASAQNDRRPSLRRWGPAARWGRSDLGIMAGRRATASGLSSYDKASFPHMKVPDTERGELDDDPRHRAAGAPVRSRRRVLCRRARPRCSSCPPPRASRPASSA